MYCTRSRSTGTACRRPPHTAPNRKKKGGPCYNSITMAAESVSIYYACNLHIWDWNTPRPSPVLFDLQADVVVGHLKENDILSHHITAWSSLGAAISKCYSHWRYRKHTIAWNKTKNIVYLSHVFLEINPRMPKHKQKIFAMDERFPTSFSCDQAIMVQHVSLLLKCKYHYRPYHFFFNGSELSCGMAMTEHKFPGGQKCPAGHSWVKMNKSEKKLY